MKKSMIIAAVAAAAIFAGCQKDTPGGENSPETTGNEISFRALTDKTQTRATLVDGNNINSFTVSAIWNDPDAEAPSTFNYMDNINVTRGINGASTWTYNPIKYWPKKGTVDFFAFSPAGSVNVTDFHISGDGPYNIWLDYTVPYSSASKKAEDLLVAETTGLTGGQVALTFQHALSLVTFSAKNITTAATYNITGLELTGNFSSGSLLFDAPNVIVRAMTGTATFTYPAGLPEAGATVLPGGPTAEFVGLLGPNEGMMMMPQGGSRYPGEGIDEDDVNDGTAGSGTPDGIPDDFLVAGKNYLVVTYGVTDQMGDEILPAGTKAYFPVDLQYIMGQAYDFQITLGGELNPVSFTVNVNPWPVASDQPIPQP